MMTGTEQRSRRVNGIEHLIRAFYDAPHTAQSSTVGNAVAVTLIQLGMLPALPAPVVLGTAADALAIDLGYTRRVEIEGGCQGGEFLIQPDMDLDDTFKAWGVDWQEWTMVHGCNVLIAECDA